MIRVEFRCLEGVATVYSTRMSEGDELLAGESTVQEVSAADARDPADLIAQAWNAAGIGASGTAAGRVEVTPLDVPVTVRHYLEVNRFLDPDADDHVDRVLAVGESYEADTVRANVVTLMPIGPALTPAPKR